MKHELLLEQLTTTISIYRIWFRFYASGFTYYMTLGSQCEIWEYTLAYPRLGAVYVHPMFTWRRSTTRRTCIVEFRCGPMNWNALMPVYRPQGGALTGCLTNARYMPNRWPLACRSLLQTALHATAILSNRLSARLSR